jgi:hypothetical protein
MRPCIEDIMSVENIPGATRLRRPQSHHTKSWPAAGSALDQPLSLHHDSQVLFFHEWCRLNRFSERTGRRILKSGNGPVVTQLSPKRVGITIGADRAWKAARARTETQTSEK